MHARGYARPRGRCAELASIYQRPDAFCLKPVVFCIADIYQKPVVSIGSVHVCDEETGATRSGMEFPEVELAAIGGWGVV